MKVSGHGGQGFFHFHNLPNLREEPRIDLGDLMDFLNEKSARKAWRMKKIRSALGMLSLRVITSLGRMSRSS